MITGLEENQQLTNWLQTTTKQPSLDTTNRKETHVDPLPFPIPSQGRTQDPNGHCCQTETSDESVWLVDRLLACNIIIQINVHIVFILRKQGKSIMIGTIKTHPNPKGPIYKFMSATSTPPWEKGLQLVCLHWSVWLVWCRCNYHPDRLHLSRHLLQSSVGKPCPTRPWIPPTATTDLWMFMHFHATILHPYSTH